MKVYYILSVLSIEDKNFFFDSIKDIHKPEDVDNIIKTRYYRVNKVTTNTTYNSITLETWMFIKTIWDKYWVSPDQINWIYKENMVILNDDLWLYNSKNNEWNKISWEKNTYFFTSRYSFWNIFWAFFNELSKIHKNFPKLIYPNKNLIYTRKEKIRFIMNAYTKRKKIIGNFMLPLMYTRSTQSIKSLLSLWKNEVWDSDILIKKSRWTDNWKHITLLNVEEYLWNDQKIDYLFLKYISFTNEFDSWIYFTSYFDIEKEYRLYYAKDKITSKYNLYSAKQKINLTSKEDLLSKMTLWTWSDLKVKWELLDNNSIPKELDKIAKFVFKSNDLEVWVIEFIKLSNWEYRFLEINCLWGSMMFEWKDEENIKDLISNWWNFLYNKDIK